jgi:hypothetical protein
MNTNFEYTTNLQYKVKSLSARVQAFESGEKYVAMRVAFKAQLSGRDQAIRGLKAELADAHRALVAMRHNWMQVYDDLAKEHANDLAKKDRGIKELEERALMAEEKLDALKGDLRNKSRELYQVKTALEEERGKNHKLLAQINRNHENSSVPSSLKPGRKKITNNREKTGKKPGGQPGHEGHPRKKHIPTNLIHIPAPEKYANSPDYKPTGKTIVKQVVGICVKVVVDEYSTPEFRHVRTGQRVHADFPAGVVNEVNYDGSVKSFAFLLNNYCNVSVAKVASFLSELTYGELKISTGMINGLSKEFSARTEEEQKKAFADILLSPVINVDFTTARVSGRKVNVLVCATPRTVIYFAREQKGHAGIKETPLEEYLQIVVHDHDLTFYNYGGAHQECMDHASRYLLGSMENEPGLEWNWRMRELIREMIHFRNGLDPDDDRDPDKIDPARVGELEGRYDAILELAKKEYEYEPPSKYYREGFNLYKRMLKYRDCHLLFLHDRRVPHSNNLAERLLRIYKRKQAQVMTFRSFAGLDYLCRAAGVIASFNAQGKNLFESVASIFGVPNSKGAKIAS